MEEKAKQWYEENPELMEVEKAAMEKLAKDDYKKLLFLKDGSGSLLIEEIQEENVMEVPTHEDAEILRMKELLAQGFDDTDVADGTIDFIVSEDCLHRRNTEYEK